MKPARQTNQHTKPSFLSHRACWTARRSGPAAGTRTGCCQAKIHPWRTAVAAHCRKTGRRPGGAQGEGRHTRGNHAQQHRVSAALCHHPPGPVNPLCHATAHPTQKHAALAGSAGAGAGVQVHAEDKPGPVARTSPRQTAHPHAAAGLNRQRGNCQGRAGAGAHFESVYPPRQRAAPSQKSCARRRSARTPHPRGLAGHGRPGEGRGTGGGIAHT